MKNENYDDMKKLFYEEIELPESLSKENIMKKIKESGVKQKKKVKLFPRVVAAAAVFAVVATGAFAVHDRSFGSNRPVSFEDVRTTEEIQNETAPENQKVTEKTTYSSIDVGTKKVALSKFKSEKDLNNYFSNLAKKTENKTYFEEFFNVGIKKNAASADMAPTEAAHGNTGNTADQSSSSSFGKTNTQVSGVDEADVIKNDGNYLYVVSGGKLSIIDAKTMKLASQTEFKSENSKNGIDVFEIYVNGDRLVVNGREYEKSDAGDYEGYTYGTKCCVFYKVLNSISIVYDISDRENVREIRRVRQDGEVISTRMIGTYLYIATGYSPDLEGGKKKDYTPAVDGTKLTNNDVYVQSKDSGDSSYIVLSGYDTANEKSEVSSVSVLESGYEVYCSKDTFYVASDSYNEKYSRCTTTIHAFSLKDGKVAYKNSGSVPGSLDDQYMMDQNGEYFRIATNDYNYKTDLDVSSLYVLDGEMNVIGKLENIAKDEQIKSVRFMGNTAYVVTFKNTDPLFAIDLSKPNEPKILGSVKLPGFSEYLHPISENLLVGIGYDGDEEDADFNKVKISLFDVSDKKNPKELDSHIIKNASCDVNYSSKSFLTIDENTFGIPVYYYVANGGKLVFKTFTVENGKFGEKGNYIHSGNSNGSNIFRGTFIGDYIYTVDDTTVKQFNMKTEEELAALDYMPESENEEPAVDVKNIDEDVTVF